MTLPAYDRDNIFTKIIAGDLPCHKVFEDDQSFAFMDIMPRSDGHTLVIPKEDARSLLDVSPESLARTMEVTRMIARAAMDAFDADGITLQQFSEPAGGQEVFHLHFHVLPRYDGVRIRPPGTRAEDALLADHATRLRAVLDG